MTTEKALDGKPHAGNPHVRFDEGEVAPAAKPRRGSLLYKRGRMLAFAAVIAACAASASTNTWITVGSDGSWSDVANWDGGAKPAPDGSSDVVISNNVSSASVSRKIIVNEDASVKSLRLMQGATANTADTISGAGILTIGSGGVTSRNYSYPSAPDYGTTHGRPPRFECPIVLGASQIWQLSYDGQVNSDWYSFIRNDISGDAAVDWMLTGCKWRFESGSSEKFHGRVWPQRPVLLAGAGQFNRLGPEIVLCDTNCFNSSYNTPDPGVVFYHTASGTGVVNSAIHFDCTNSTAVTPGIKVTQANPSLENTTIFRGNWTGALRGYEGMSLYPNGNRYGIGVVMNDSGESGMFRPETSVWRFENDTSGLAVLAQNITSGNKYVTLVNNIFVMAGDNAFGAGNNFWGTGFYVSSGRPQRLAGILTTNGRTLNKNDAQYALYVGESNYPKGNVVLFGISEPGYAEGMRVNMVGAIASDGGEAPVWLYAVPGGTYRQHGTFIFHGSGVRYLPFQIWGGGTVVIDAFQYALTKGRSPFWVRDGRLVVGGSAADYGIQAVDVQVGVSHPKSFTVKAMEMSPVSGSPTYSSDCRKLTFASVFEPDGVTLSVGDRVLLNCPTTSGTWSNSARFNGIWEVTGATEWTRIEELDESDECLPDIRVDVEYGTRWAGTRWFLMNEPYRICKRLGKATTQNFNDSNYCLAFYQDVRPNPDVSLLLEGDRTLTNFVSVVDNQSTGRSELGGYTTNSTPSFTGPISITKPMLTVTANTNSTVTFSGEMSGTVGISKVGAGDVVLSPSGSGLSVTNLAVASGRLSINSALLAPGVDVAEFVYGGGESATLELTGDVDLSGWTLTVTGLYRPERGATELPEPFTISVASAGGTVSGQPTIRLLGAPTGWSVDALGGNVWRVTYRKPGITIVFR